jgi:hypothetical protein
MEIDPLEVVIKWLAANLTKAGGRVAGKHRYGVEWKSDQLGVSVILDGGQPELYGSTSKIRVEVQIRAEKRIEVIDAWRELVDLSRESERTVVSTSLGSALMHYFKQDSGFSILYDKDLNKEMGLAFFEALVAEEAVA